VLDTWINISGNLTLSRNKVASYIEYIDNYDTGDQNAVAHKNTDISFSPSVIGGMTINILPANNIELSLVSKYVGKQYMDNSQNETRKLNRYFVQDMRASWTIKHVLFSEWRIVGQINNVFNKKYEPNGYTYSYISGGILTNDNGYYPMAGTSYMVGVNIKF
jgi:iron complex outermembrane receptor protein